MFTQTTGQLTHRKLTMILLIKKRPSKLCKTLPLSQGEKIPYCTVKCDFLTGFQPSECDQPIHAQTIIISQIFNCSLYPLLTIHGTRKSQSIFQRPVRLRATLKGAGQMSLSVSTFGTVWMMIIYCHELIREFQLTFQKHSS